MIYSVYRNKHTDDILFKKILFTEFPVSEIYEFVIFYDFKNDYNAIKNNWILLEKLGF